MEWTNLARDAKYDEVKRRLARHLPKTNAADAKPGGKRRKRRGK